MVKNREEVSAFLHYCLQNGFPFYVYQLPGFGTIQIGVQTNLDLKSYQYFAELKGEKGFVFSPFDTASHHQSWFIRSDINLQASEITSDSVQLLEKFTLGAVQKNQSVDVFESSRDLYFNQVSEMIKDLKQKKLDKAILSRIQVLDNLGREDSVNSFLKLSDAYHSAFVFLVSIPHAGCWVGASPETLLSANHEKTETHALAGTQKLGNRQPDEILWERKEMEEQAYVSNFIENTLVKHHLEDCVKEGPVTVQAGNVVHLKTTYQLPSNMDFNHLSDLIHDLHPTPAVCGLPKTKALELIREIEQHDREYYAGYLGPVEPNGCISLFVNLRSMKVLENRMALFVGGGITADSVPEKEWEETCLKAQTLLNVIRK